MVNFMTNICKLISFAPIENSEQLNSLKTRRKRYINAPSGLIAF